ncbi:MAG: ABC transporter substrate-binding protein, partial [Lachnospiraceae bacterium]|nr:ABC transporter substrate-binding protein [Lachnospiraceae bacterium]
MTKRRKKHLHLGKALLVSMLLTLTIALGGCAGDKEADDSSQITIGIPQDLDSLDPNVAVASGTQEILFNVYEGLYKPDSDGNLVPAVASDCAISEDGLTYTFTLREGVKFHNGNPVTVEDVVYSMNKCAGDGSGEPLVSAFSIVENVEATDDKTVVITLSEANKDFLAILSATETCIVPADVEDLETTPVGTGPYKIVSRSLQENVILEKFDEYWGEPANIENVTLKIIADSDSILMNLQGGAIDLFARVTSSTASGLGDDFNVLEGSMNLVQSLYLNNAVEPFNNEKVRQALSYAVNKQEIFDFVADGKGTAVASSMFPAFGKYYMEELNEVYATDIEKAKQLLAEA